MAVITALVTTAVLFGMAAIVVELGLLRDAKRQSQIAADASALAAAHVLYAASSPDFGAAVDAAHQYSDATSRSLPKSGPAAPTSPP